MNLGEAAALMGANATSMSAEMFDKQIRDYSIDSRSVGAGELFFALSQQDYARAVDTFETVLNNHPDARFLDVILFNYGRCLYRMNRRGEARQRFDQLLQDYPESPLAADAKKISDALAKAGGQ